MFALPLEQNGSAKNNFCCSWSKKKQTTKARESREDERVSVPCLYFLFIQLEEELNDL